MVPGMSKDRCFCVRWSLPVLLVGVLAGGVVTAFGQNGPAVAPVEPGKLLEQLKALEETVTKARTGNNLAAIDVIREASTAEAKAVALWMESVRETEFREKDKKESDFRAWREGPGRKLSEAGAAGALRLHLQYLLLTLQVTAATTEEARVQLFGPLLAYLDDLSRADKEVLKNRQYLDMSVLATPIARRYKLDITVRAPEGWSLVPGNLEAMYETTLLPALRERKDVVRLQTAWARRLQQEAAMVEAQGSEVVSRDYRETILPGLEWAQARDLQMAGDPGAAVRMLQLIQQNQSHRNAPQWIRELRSLLAPDAVGGGGVGPSGKPGSGATAPPEAPAPAAAPAPPPAPGTKAPAATLPSNRTR